MAKTTNPAEFVEVGAEYPVLPGSAVIRNDRRDGLLVVWALAWDAERGRSRRAPVDSSRCPFLASAVCDRINEVR